MGLLRSLLDARESANRRKDYKSPSNDPDHERIAHDYYKQIEMIEDQWSVLYNLKAYSGRLAADFEEMCLENIELYKQMATIEHSYGEDSPPSAPAFKRLAMLYEKNGSYEKARLVCVDALCYGASGGNMKGRLARMIKK